MSDENTQGTFNEKAAVNAVSDIRVDAAKLLEKVNALTELLATVRHPAGREIALVKTKLQEARMWGGMALSHFDTGFKPSDVPGDHESKSSAQ